MSMARQNPLTHHTDLIEHTAHRTSAIILKDIRAVFARRRAEPFKALDDVSFEVPKGKVFCLLGPNGSGKTTTINVITGLLRPTAGTVQVLGMEPSRERAKILRAVALVPQETALYNELTPYENLLFHAHYYDVGTHGLSGRIDNVLELVQLRGRQHDRVGTFSGGMQRRLALARALLSEPEILLLDEPTLGVDVQSRQAIWDQIRRLATLGKTVFLTTNYMEEAEALADIILILDRGKPVVMGAPEALKASVRRKRLVLQFGEALSAEKVRARLSQTYAVEQEGTRVHLEVDSAASAMLVMQTLPEKLGRHSDGLVSLELKDPSLQDAFLHFTGRALRD
jgi:ABC-2 type transport system ATP-binding protein